MRNASSSSRSASVSPGKPTMTLQRMPACGASARTRVEQVEEGLAASRSGASSAAAARRRAGRRCRSRARRRGSSAMARSRPGPDLGRLEVGDPHPLDARRWRSARAAASRAGRGRRGPCRRRWSSRETRKSSLTPCSASQRASAMTSAGRRETKAPRNIGMAQNAHRRSQPLAIFSGAHGRPSRRARMTRGPEAGDRTLDGHVGAARRHALGDGAGDVGGGRRGPAARPPAAPACRAAGDSGSSVRRSEGVWRRRGRPSRMRLQVRWTCRA